MSLAAFMVLFCPSRVLAVGDELPDKLISKGGVIYPRTGDSIQFIFRAPKNVKDFLKPEMLIGVLPEDCLSVSGPEGEYFRCPHGLVLVPVLHDNEAVYMKRAGSANNDLELFDMETLPGGNRDLFFELLLQFLDTMTFIVVKDCGDVRMNQ